MLITKLGNVPDLVTKMLKVAKKMLSKGIIKL